MRVALVDQLCVSDRDKVGIDDSGVSTVQPIVQNPRHIVPVRYPEDQRFLCINA